MIKEVSWMETGINTIRENRRTEYILSIILSERRGLYKVIPIT